MTEQFTQQAQTKLNEKLFSLEGRLVLGGLNCPVGSMDDWKPVFLQMLESVELTEA